MTAAIIQARMGSTRLPGKVLLPLGGKPVLEWVVSRTQCASEIDKVILAIPDTPDNDVLEHVGARLGVQVIRGPEQDVLSRYWRAVIRTGVTYIARITADCPLIDPWVIDRVVRALERYGWTEPVYATNTIDRRMPDGLDVEAFTYRAIEQAQMYDSGPDREHVCHWMRDNCETVSIMDGPDNSSLRWTLDTQEDYEYLQRLVEGVKPVIRARCNPTTEALLARHAALSG